MTISKERVHRYDGRLNMLCISQKFAIMLSIFLILVTIILGWRFYNTFGENAKIKARHTFHIRVGYNLTKPKRDIPYDVDFDLAISPKHGTLMVDDSADISGIAILNSQYAKAQVNTISIGFENAQAYPIVQDDRGLTKGMELRLKPTSENDKLAGTGSFTYPIEGSYRPKLLFFMKNNDTKYAIADVYITAYPRTLLAQILNNETSMYLALAAYFVGAVGALNFIWRLWDGTP